MGNQLSNMYIYYSLDNLKKSKLAGVADTAKKYASGSRDGAFRATAKSSIEEMARFSEYKYDKIMKGYDLEDINNFLVSFGPIVKENMKETKYSRGENSSPIALTHQMEAMLKNPENTIDDYRKKFDENIDILKQTLAQFNALSDESGKIYNSSEAVVGYLKKLESFAKDQKDIKKTGTFRSHLENYNFNRDGGSKSGPKTYRQALGTIQSCFNNIVGDRLEVVAAAAFAEAVSSGLKEKNGDSNNITVEALEQTSSKTEHEGLDRSVSDANISITANGKQINIGINVKAGGIALQEASKGAMQNRVRTGINIDELFAAVYGNNANVVKQVYRNALVMTDANTQRAKNSSDIYGGIDPSQQSAEAKNIVNGVHRELSLNRLYNNLTGLAKENVLFMMTGSKITPMYKVFSNIAAAYSKEAKTITGQDYQPLSAKYPDSYQKMSSHNQWTGSDSRNWSDARSRSAKAMSYLAGLKLQFNVTYGYSHQSQKS